MVLVINLFNILVFVTAKKYFIGVAVYAALDYIIDARANVGIVASCLCNDVDLKRALGR